MKKAFYILIILASVSCKKASSREAKDLNTSEILVSKLSNERSRDEQKANCYDYLTELVRSSNFPFKYWNVSPNKVNLIIDEDNGAIINAKLFFETSGTGTIGWIKYNIKNRSLLNTSANLEEPENLTFDLKWALLIEKCLGINSSITKKEDSTAISLEKFYNDAKEVSLPLAYSNDFSEENDFVTISEKLYPIFKLGGRENYQIAKLPKYNDFCPILLEVYQSSGQSELYLVILDKNFKMIDKKIIYSSKEIDSGSLSTIYEINQDYSIKIKQVITTGEGLKMKETNKEIKNYIISNEGFMVDN